MSIFPLVSRILKFAPCRHVHHYLRSLFFVSASIIISNSNATEWAAEEHFADELITCSVYYSLAAKALESRLALIDDDNQMRESIQMINSFAGEWLDIATAMYQSIGRKDDALVNKYEALINRQIATINNDFTNIDILARRHGELCKSMAQDSDARANYWRRQYPE